MDDLDKTHEGPPADPNGSGEAAKPEPRDRVGTTLAGRYEILRLLGEGAQGLVYIGRHLRIGRKDAIKVLKPELLDDEDAVARFTRGASKASRINHPNVCTVYDFGETEEGLPFMASELVEGGELHEMIEREAPFTLERALHILEQTAAGLQAAHELDIVHRDLKPANVMLTRDRKGSEVVKVVDFDIAKGVGDAESGGGALTQAGWIIGTPQYMSPEQITASDLDQRSDVYSLALIFFEMITGRLPNESGSTRKLMWQRVSGELRSLEEAAPGGTFPPALQAALDRALAREPEDRTPTAVQFAREVREAIEEPEGAAPTDLAATRVYDSSDPDLDDTRSAPVGATVAEEPGEVVPPTRAAPTGEGGAEDGGRRRALPILAAVAGIAALAVGVAWGTGLIGGDGASAGGPGGEDGPEIVAESPDGSPGGGGTAGRDGGGGDAEPDGATTGDTADGGGEETPSGPGGETTTDREPPGGGTGEESATDETAPLDAEAASSQVRRMMEEILLGTPSDSQLREMLEPTERIYRSTLPDATRANAAYIHAYALFALTDDQEDEEACAWGRRALRLDPDDGATEALIQSCGR